ncbi:GIP protein, partial [Cisticola juncidis]|nr:GIP protein [Cisticola juncidis]
PAAAPRRRYSEATLASDYSRAMDHVLGRNFVEWLLARRERGSPELPEPLKREAEPQKAAEEEKFGDLGGKDSGKNREKPSFPALEGSEGLREFLEQELLLWLMSGELCR